jgi:hypothetical protein
MAVWELPDGQYPSRSVDGAASQGPLKSSQNTVQEENKSLSIQWVA